MISFIRRRRQMLALSRAIKAINPDIVFVAAYPRTRCTSACSCASGRSRNANHVPAHAALKAMCLQHAGRLAHIVLMVTFWRILNRAILACISLSVSVAAYAWMGAETPDRVFSSIMMGGIASLIWALFGATVHRMLNE